MIEIGTCQTGRRPCPPCANCNRVGMARTPAAVQAQEPVPAGARIVRAAVFPAIGFSRVGNGDQWFLAPEVPGLMNESEGGFKQGPNRVKKQVRRLKFAPQIEPIVSLYDAVREAMIASAYIKLQSGPVSFRQDVLPVLRRAGLMPWVAQAGCRGRGRPLQDAVRLTIYVSDVVRYRPLVNKVQEDLWGKGPYPPRTVLEVRKLDQDDIAEVDATFYAPAKKN